MSLTPRIGSGSGALSARLGSALNPWTLACFGVCVVIGALAGWNPTYGVLGAVGLLFAVVAIMDVTLGFILFTVASFMDVLSTTGSFSGTKVIGLVLFVSWLARIGTGRGRDLTTFVEENPALTYSLVAMLGWTVLSFAWATSPSTALSGAGRYALVMMLIPIAFGSIRRREHAVWVVTAFVVGAVVSGGYGFIHPTAATSSDAGRFTGANGDANGEATVLAASIPLLIALFAVIRESVWLKVVAVGALILMFIGLLETLSREGLLSLAAVMVGAVIFGGRWREKAALLLMVGVVATVGYYFILAPASARQRVTMADTSGRSSLWTVALRVIKAHPVLGVGNDNFLVVENHYINQPGAIQALYIVDQPKLTHNTFLEATADLGIVGLLTLLAVLYFAIRAAVRAAWIFERLGDYQMELIARAVVLSVVAVLTSDLFVAGGYAKYLWIPLGICPAMLRLARQAESREAERAQVAAAAPVAVPALN